ncbi:phage integrase SAM-like domain-containing protein [Chitinophaga sp. OAE865]|uniref:phage integrase SAM-like domain-containing protein n=1 Tax=Chitinophaga sp. OAE865 TaxID=2817898 RepID=UPI001AE2EA96
MNFPERKTKRGDKIVFYYAFGKGKGQRPSIGIFVYTNPKDQTEKKHSKQALSFIELKKSQLIIWSQAIGTDFIPPHKFKANFLDYYEEYVKTRKRKANRYFQCNLTQFKKFIGKDHIAPVEVNENICKSFHCYLLDKYTGEHHQVITRGLNGYWYRPKDQQSTIAQLPTPELLPCFLII